MVSVYTLGQSSWPLTTVTQNSFSIGHPMASNPDSCVFAQFQYASSKTATEPDTPLYRQWPWRGFAFCSDLGTVGYLINKPKLGLFGWALALPYYLYALFKQPKGPQRSQEFAYQATANGLLPFLEAKAGVITGGYIAKRFKPLVKPSLSKLTGGLTALLALTSTVGDPLSDWMLKQYKTYLRKGQTG